MENTDVQIQQYLNQSLSGEALAAFEQRLRSDKALQIELSLARQGRAAFSGRAAGDEATFRELLGQTSKSYFETPLPLEKTAQPVAVRRRLPVRMRWAAAAAVLLLAFAGMKWYADRYYSLAGILAQNYAPAATPATLSEGQYDMQEAYAAWRNKQWAAAAQSFGSVPPDDERYAEAQLFAGYALYESGQWERAVAAFNSVIQTDDVRFSANAEWHRLLALLAHNPQDEAARQALSDLSNDTVHPYHPKAKQLKKQLGHPLRALTR